MTKTGLKGQKQLTGYKKMIHNEMFKLKTREEVIEQIKEERYVMYYYNIGEFPNNEDYGTVIQDKYKGISRDEAIKLYVDTLKY
jgi:hypothetical protein